MDQATETPPASPKDVKIPHPALSTKNSSGHRFPILSKLKAKNLYLLQSLPLPEISLQTGLSEKQLSNLCSREGWAKEKRRREKALELAADTRANNATSEAIEAIASESEELAMQGLVRTREALNRNDKTAPKDFQAYTAGVRNLATVAKLVRATELPSVTSAVQINFFGGAQPVMPEPTPVKRPPGRPKKDKEIIVEDSTLGLTDKAIDPLNNPTSSPRVEQ